MASPRQRSNPEIFNDRFKILNECLGLGDPKAGIWFVGYEEGGTWDAKSFNDISPATHPKGYAPETLETKQGLKGKQKREPVRVSISQVCQPLSQKFRDQDWRKYRDEILWMRNSGVFITNLLPIRKKEVAALPEQYERFFGLSRKTFDEYVQLVRDSRFSEIKKLFYASKPQAVVCFSKSLRKWYEEVFDIRSSAIKLSENISRYPDKNIFVVSHFSWRGFKGAGSKKRFLAELSKQLRDSGVALP